MSQENPHDLTGKLTFDSDKGSWRSKFMAVLFAIVLALWMGSGYIFPSNATAEVEEENQAPRAVAVAVMQSSADDVALVLTAEGQSTPDRATKIQAEATGTIISVSVARGDLVEAGQELGRLDAETFEAQLDQANAQLEQATTELDRSVTLQAQGIMTESAVLQNRAALASAQAGVTAAQERLDQTIIRAPFAGRLNDMTLDEGEFVKDGDMVAEVLDNNPLSIVVQVPQQALSRLEKGGMAEVSFITGETRMGTVQFIGSNADSQTRTFRVEVSVDNPDSTMPAGLSARVAIPTGQVRGHFISPAILSLDTDGTLGIKTVTEDNTVAFSKITIVRAQTDGIWVTGLGETASIITVGQGFVNRGDTVDPRQVDADLTAQVSQ